MRRCYLLCRSCTRYHNLVFSPPLLPLVPSPFRQVPPLCQLPHLLRVRAYRPPVQCHNRDLVLVQAALSKKLIRLRRVTLLCLRSYKFLTTRTTLTMFCLSSRDLYVSLASTVGMLSIGSSPQRRQHQGCTHGKSSTPASRMDAVLPPGDPYSSGGICACHQCSTTSNRRAVSISSSVTMRCGSVVALLLPKARALQ
jgi:hypothetical protein